MLLLTKFSKQDQTFSQLLTSEALAGYIACLKEPYRHSGSLRELIEKKKEFSEQTTKTRKLLATSTVFSFYAESREWYLTTW